MEVTQESTHLGHWIKVIDHIATTCSNRILEPYGLTRTTWYIIYYISEVGETPQKDLQNLLEIESGSLAIIVNGLVKKGWLERKASKTDRRSKYLFLSKDGKRRWKEVPNFIEILREKMMEGISEEEESLAIEVIKKAWNNLNKFKTDTD